MAHKNKDIVYDSPPGDPDDNFWLDQGKKLLEGSLESVHEAAKALMTGAGVVQGIYLGILGLSDYISKTMPILEKSLYLIPLALWLFSLHAALQVMMTDTHEVNLHSPEEIRGLSKSLLTEKQSRVQKAFQFFAAGIVAAILLLILRVGT